MSRRGNFLELPSYQSALRAQLRGPVEPEDTSHLDNELLSDRCDLILAETEKAYKLRLGSWRIKQRDVWAAKSQVRLVTEGGMQHALFPIWLAKKWGYSITLETKTRKPRTTNCEQCGVEITTYTTAPPPKCEACYQLIN
jgi:hypothetical protein